MKDIREFCTSGMDLWEREDLFKNTIPIELGAIVYRSGDAFEWTQPVIVNKENQKEVSMFWNALYFDNEADADLVTNIAHANYSRYQESCIYGTIF